MKRTPVMGTRYRLAFADVGRVCLGISRFLLVLTAIELVSMPLTQHLWTWDRYLHGGQDFESNLLIAVTFLCLVLLVAQKSKQCVDRLLAIGRVLWGNFHRRKPAQTIPNRKSPNFLSGRLISCFFSLNSLPLKI